MRDHPDKFRRGGGARWMGIVYGGGAMCAEDGCVIYHGAMGSAAYQQLTLTMQPQRPLPPEFQQTSARLKLFLAKAVQPCVRSISRWWYSLAWRSKVMRSSKPTSFVLVDHISQYKNVETRWSGGSEVDRYTVLLAFRNMGWDLLDEISSSEWDLVYDGMRLLIACEVHDGASLILVRSETKSGKLPQNINEVMLGIGLSRYS